MAIPTIQELVAAGRVFGDRSKEKEAIEARLQRDKVSAPLVPVLHLNTNRKGKYYVSRGWAVELPSGKFNTYHVRRDGRVQLSPVVAEIGLRFQIEF